MELVILSLSFFLSFFPSSFSYFTKESFSTNTIYLLCASFISSLYNTLSALYHMKMSNTVSTRINRFNFPLQCKIQLLNLHHELHPLLNYGNLQWLCYLSSTSESFFFKISYMCFSHFISSSNPI